MIRNIYFIHFGLSDVSILNLGHEKVLGGTNL